MNDNLTNGLNQFIQVGEYFHTRSVNFHTYICVVIKNGGVLIHTNSGLDVPRVVEIKKFIKQSNFENIIFSVRSELEPYPELYPNEVMLDMLLDGNSNITLFNQEQWPAEVPNFVDTNLVIRFGFDQGCELDLLQLEEPLPLSTFGILNDDSRYQNGIYHYLLNKNETIKLKSVNTLV
jgi:hypothetical protein